MSDATTAAVMILGISPRKCPGGCACVVGWRADLTKAGVCRAYAFDRDTQGEAIRAALGYADAALIEVDDRKTWDSYLFFLDLGRYEDLRMDHP